MINFAEIKKTRKEELIFKDLEVGTPYQFILIMPDTSVFKSSPRIKISKKKAFVFGAGKSEVVESTEKVRVIKTLEITNI